MNREVKTCDWADDIASVGSEVPQSGHLRSGSLDFTASPQGSVKSEVTSKITEGSNKQRFNGKARRPCKAAAEAGRHCVVGPRPVQRAHSVPNT